MVAQPNSVFEKARAYVFGFSRPFWAANLSELFERIAYYAMAPSLVPYLTQVRGFDETSAIRVGGNLGFIVYGLTILSGLFADWLGYRRAMIVANVDGCAMSDQRIDDTLRPSLRGADDEPVPAPTGAEAVRILAQEAIELVRHVEGNSRRQPDLRPRRDEPLRHCALIGQGGEVERR